MRFRYYEDSLIPGYFDFTSHPETRIAIHMMVRDVEAYIEAPVSVIWTDAQRSSPALMHPFLRAQNAWAETQQHLKEIFVDDFTKLDVRRDDGSDTIVISRPLPGQPGGVRELHIPERDEDKDTVLVFEQAVLAALSESDLGTGPLGHDDTAFWADIEEVLGTVSQTLENLTRA